MNYKARVTQYLVAPEGQPKFNERTWSVSIDDLIASNQELIEG